MVVTQLGLRVRVVDECVEGRAVPQQLAVTERKGFGRNDIRPAQVFKMVITVNELKVFWRNIHIERACKIPG